MSPISFNALWVICVLAILIAFALAIRRRRLASRETAQPEPYVYRVYSRQLETVLVHRESNAYPSTIVYTQPANGAAGQPPAFDSVQLPPPSYQDYQKDTRIQQSVGTDQPECTDQPPYSDPPPPPPQVQVQSQVQVQTQPESQTQPQQQQHQQQ